MIDIAVRFCSVHGDGCCSEFVVQGSGMSCKVCTNEYHYLCRSGISEEKSLRNDRCEEILQLQAEGKVSLQAKLQEETAKELKAQKKKETEGKMLRDAAMRTLGGNCRTVMICTSAFRYDCLAKN